VNVRNFHILIVSSVKICKQCLQTASTLGTFPQTLYRGFAPGLHWGTSVPKTPGLQPPNEISWCRYCC